MVQVHDLYRTGKLSVSEVPDPDGSVAEDDFFIGAAPAALPGFGIETATELLSRFNRSGVGSRSFITQGPSLLVDSGLCEHRAQFYLAGMGRCVAVLSLPPLGFSAHYRHARAIHLDIQNRNARAGHDGQIELEGAVDWGLLAFCDSLSNRFGVPGRPRRADRVGGRGGLGPARILR